MLWKRWLYNAVLWIRIRLDPELLFRVWIQQKMKKQINRKFIFNITPVNSVLCVLYDCTMKRTDSK